MAFVGEAALRRRPPAEAVIFDMDGLLVDTEPTWRAVEVAVFDDLGVDVRPLLGGGLTAGMRVDEVVASFRTQLAFEGPSDEEVARRIVEGVVAEVARGVVLKPSAAEALAAFAGRGLRLGLASGSAMPVVDAVLDRTGLRGRFAAVCSAVDDPIGKPHPAVFLRTARLLGADPTACVVLEDSLNGCIAAKAARMRVVAVPEADNAADVRFSIADLRLSSLAGLGEVDLEELLGTGARPRVPAGHAVVPRLGEVQDR